MISRGKATHISPRALYPHEILSGLHVLKVKIVEPNRHVGEQTLQSSASDDVNNYADLLDAHQQITMRTTSIVDKLCIGHRKSR